MTPHTDKMPCSGPLSLLTNVVCPYRSVGDVKGLARLQDAIYPLPGFLGKVVLREVAHRAVAEITWSKDGMKVSKSLRS